MSTSNITRSVLIARLAEQFDISPKKSDKAVKRITACLIDSLCQADRIEIRRFGSFEIRTKAPRVARNPKTGESVPMGRQYTVHFKPGQPLRQRVDNGRKQS